MIISLIAALTVTDSIIGIKNNVPWYIPIDLQWFKCHTVNKPIIMGRKTFESIGNKPLKNRLNIVMSHFLLSRSDNKEIYIVRSVDQALYLVKNFYEVMIIGGGEVYRMFLPKAKRLYLTYIKTNFYIFGDTQFPIYNLDEWKFIFSKFYNVVEKGNYYNLSFNILERL